MKRALLIACVGLALGAAALQRLAALPALRPPHAGPGDVTAVSVLPSPGRAEVVVDVQGTVRVSDFVLRDPARLVLDLVGAHLVAPTIQYDGVARGGIRDVRYSQFRSDVVRVVVQLDEARDYQVSQDSAGVHVTFAAAQAFAAWSSDGARNAAAPLPAAIPARAAAAPVEPAPAPSTTTSDVENAVLRSQRRSPSQQPRISVTFDRASISEVIANFAAFSGRSIIAGKDIQGTVTAEIKDQPWDLAFNAVLAGQGLAATELPGGILRVDSRANLAAQDSLEGTATTIVKVNYARASVLAPSVAPMLSRRGKVAPDTTTNSLIVTDIASQIDTIAAFIHALDQRTPQVAIQAKIIFVDRTELEEIGMQYDLGTSSQFFNTLIARPNPQDTTGNTPFDPTRTPLVVNLGGNAVAAVANASAQFQQNPALRLVYSTVIGNFALSSFLQALQSVQLSDIQAEPQVTVADNRQADLFVGERTPIRQIDVASTGATATGGAVARATTQLQPTGIRLTVTPHVVAGTREVLMELHAENSSLQASTIAEAGFVFASQEGTTQLLVRDGETAVIGGLTVTNITVANQGIPFLVDLPVLGRLFGFRTSQEERRDLLILVTPHIIDDLSSGATDNR
ncbi:MAG TPA: secretin N-terminal domain-containing protein [Gemmatimonadales bacterium]|nr:secretin N-terminal domain-containing protein [Gemmatimonadales bacterium]